MEHCDPSTARISTPLLPPHICCLFTISCLDIDRTVGYYYLAPSFLRIILLSRHCAVASPTLVLISLSVHCPDYRFQTRGSSKSRLLNEWLSAPLISSHASPCPLPTLDIHSRSHRCIDFSGQALGTAYLAPR